MSEQRHEEQRRGVVARVKLGVQGLRALHEPGSRGEVFGQARAAGLLAARRAAEFLPGCAAGLGVMDVALEWSEEAQEVRVELSGTDEPPLGFAAAVMTSVIVDLVLDPEAVIELTRRPDSSALALELPPLSSPPPLRRANAEAESEAVAAALSDRRSLGRGHRLVSELATALAERVVPIPVDDPELLALLSADPVGSAYMLGDLEVPFAEHCRWYGVRMEGAPLRSVLLHYRGLSMPAVLTMGAAEEVEALFLALRKVLPRAFYANIPESHRAALEVFYDFTRVARTIRLGLDLNRADLSGDVEDVFPVTHRDTAALMKLFQHYPDHFFEPAQLDTGLYCGLKAGDELVCAAGLHVMAETYNVAALGNVVTHADYRRLNYATRCIRWLLMAMKERVRYVALNVNAENEAAIRLHEAFGFTPHFRFLQGWAALR